MGIIVKPNIKVDDIKIDMDILSEKKVTDVINEFGRSIPLIKIGDYVVNVGELIHFELKLAINSFPRFSLSLDDTNLQIRAALKQAIDKCVIFIGYKSWYIKFNGLITQIDSDAGDAIIHLDGIWFNPKMYYTEQKSYKDQKIIDILTTICQTTDMGLYTFDNEDLNKDIDYVLNTETPQINFLVDDVIKKYTTNVFAFDTFGFLHIGNIETMRNQPYDKYTLKQTGETIDPQDIIFSSKTRQYLPEDEFKIPIEFYTLNTNFSKMFLENASIYNVSIQSKIEKILKSDPNVGFGEIGSNTFSGFEKHKFPFYSNIVNKSLGGNIITITLKNLMFEVTPFSIVGFDCYLPETGDKQFRLDTEHSGKKIVIGYSIEYTKPDEQELNSMIQTIIMI